MKTIPIFFLLVLVGCGDREERIVAARRELRQGFPNSSTFEGPIALARIGEFVGDHESAERIRRDLRDEDLVFIVEEALKFPLVSTDSDGRRTEEWRNGRCVAIVREGRFVTAYFSVVDKARKPLPEPTPVTITFALPRS